jgi:hypothetical protein
MRAFPPDHCNLLLAPMINVSARYATITESQSPGSLISPGGWTTPPGMTRTPGNSSTLLSTSLGRPSSKIQVRGLASLAKITGSGSLVAVKIRSVSVQSCGSIEVVNFVFGCERSRFFGSLEPFQIASDQGHEADLVGDHSGDAERDNPACIHNCDPNVFHIIHRVLSGLLSSYRQMWLMAKARADRNQLPVC